MAEYDPIYAKNYREKNKERIKAYNAEYRARQETKLLCEEYREENKEYIRERSKKYHKKYWELNKEKVKERKREYNSRPEVKAQKAKRNVERYKQKREEILARQVVRRKERLGFINCIAAQYGCQNPECKWQGELIGCQFDFHHYDPTTKIIEVSKLDSSSYEKIITEINKCVVLCKNCHALVHADKIILNEAMKCRIIGSSNNRSEL